MSEEERIIYWKGIMDNCCHSGQNISVWCKDNDICISSYYKWKRKLKGYSDNQSFIPVVVNPTETNCDIEIVLNGVAITCHSDILPVIIRSLK